MIQYNNTEKLCLPKNPISVAEFFVNTEFTVLLMFIKSTKVKDYEYINLVESYRGENGTTKHRVLYNFGRRDQLCEDKSFRKIVLKLCELAEIKVLDEDAGEDAAQK